MKLNLFTQTCDKKPVKFVMKIFLKMKCLDLIVGILFVRVVSIKMHVFVYKQEKFDIYNPWLIYFSI